MRIGTEITTKYGVQRVINVDKVRIQYSYHDESLRIFLGKGLKPLYVGKDSSLYKQIKEQV